MGWALQQALEETRSALEAVTERPDPAAVLASIADLTRSNAFLSRSGAPASRAREAASRNSIQALAERPTCS